MKPGALKVRPAKQYHRGGFWKIEGQGATNVVPQTVELAGTMRTMNEDYGQK